MHHIEMCDYKEPDSFVGDLKLVTNCECWWLNFDVVDIFWMLNPHCWCSTLIWKDTGCWWPKPSLRFDSYHQHISSPTFVFKIFVTGTLMTAPNYKRFSLNMTLSIICSYTPVQYRASTGYTRGGYSRSSEEMKPVTLKKWPSTNVK